MTDLRGAGTPVHPTAPGWFRQALAVPRESDRVMVNGASIHYLAWGDPGQRGLVFVHGGGAHAHWWTHVAATFAPWFRVVALDLSGHGDSDHRDEYSLKHWADEVVAVAGASAMDGPPVVVGHSMGGFVTIGTAALHPDRVAAAVVVDSPVTEEDPEVSSARVGEAFGVPKIYPTVDDALLRFRTVPRQENYLDYVMDHVGRQSLRPAGDGWCWKFDHRVFTAREGPVRSTAVPYLDQVRCRFALLRCEHGLVTRDIGRFMYERLGRVAPVVEIPEAGHHPMLDVPLLVITALRTLLADWAHSEPLARPR